MALSNLYGWNDEKENAASSSCGTACGAGDSSEKASTACGTACGASDK